MAERSIINLQKLDEQLTCPVCLELYRNPKGLPCQHSFCQDCLGRTAVTRQGDKYFLHCPSCRTPAQLPDGGVPALPPAFFINSFVELRQQMMAMQDAMECGQHKRPLEAFCISCQELVCFACATHSHRTDDYQLISDIIQDYRHELEEGMESVQQVLAAVMKAMLTLDSCDEELVRHGVEVEQRIHYLAKEVRAAVNRKEAKLVEEVRTAILLKRGMVALQKKEAQSEAAKLQNSVEFVKQNLKVCSDKQIVSSKQQILNHVKAVVAKIKNSKLKTMEKADIVFDANPKVVDEYENLGSLRKLNFNYKCLLSRQPVSSNKVARGELSLLHTDGYPLPVCTDLISCQATSCVDSQPLECAVEEAGPGRYQFSFTPVTPGFHQLRVQFQGRDIPGGLFTISTTLPSPETRGQPLGTIQGLQYPVDVAVSNSGQVIVSDNSAHCLFLFDINLECVRTVGSHGSDSNQFRHPNSVAISHDDCIIVADSSNHRIQVLTMAGQFLRSVGKRGRGQLHFDYPISIAVHSSGQVLVSEFFGKRIQVLKKDFSFSQMFDFGNDAIIPHSIAEHRGVIFITDYGCSRVIKLSFSGEILAKFGCEGTAQGQLHRPVGIAVGADGFVYVCERKNMRISVFTSDGELIKCFGGRGGQGALNSPRGVAYGSDGKLYVCDSLNKRVVIF